MNQVEALYNFFSSFNMPAYPKDEVPKDTEFPWLTYDNPSGVWEDQISCSVDLWFHTKSEQIPYRKVKEIRERIGMGGVLLRCDEGVIWVKPASPFCISLSDEADATVKRRQISLMLEFLTRS